MKFANLVEICLWPHLAVKGLKGLCHEDTADIGQFCAQLFSSFNPCPSLPFVCNMERTNGRDIVKANEVGDHPSHDATLTADLHLARHN